MNLLVKLAVAAALLSAASVSAFATSVTPPTSGPVPVPGLTNGGVIIEIYDTSAGTSMAEWLGGDVGTLGAPTAVPTSGFTLDYGIPTTATGGNAFTSLFSAADIAAGKVQFSVSAVNDTAPAAPIVDATLSKIGNITQSAIAAVGSANNTGVASILNGTTACNNVNPCLATAPSSPNYAVPKFGGNLGGFASTTSAAGIVGGAAVDFYQIVGHGTALTLQTPILFTNNGTAGAATWAVSATGDIVYSAPPVVGAVPLPPAVWLLGSGLLGLAGIARRKMLSA